MATVQAALYLALPARWSGAGIDWFIYRTAALRWEAGGPYFLPRQLEGPYILGSGEVLYPPVALWLLVPFAHLPDVLWYATPIVILGAVVWRMRPTGWAIPALALLLCLPHVQRIYLFGQPTMWIPAFLGLGLLFGGWAVLVLLKPSLFPFAIVGMRRRSWWLTAAGLALLCLPFGSMWFDWVRAVMNSNGGFLYSMRDISLLAIPVVAWLGRTRAQSGPFVAPEPSVRR